MDFEISDFGTPGDLAEARDTAHGAAQMIARAAAANLAARADYSHTALTWHGGRLASEPMAGRDAPVEVALGFRPLTLSLTAGPGTRAHLPLDGVSPAAALAWLDARLSDTGLHPASAAPGSSDLPPGVTGLQRFENRADLQAVATWYAVAAARLAEFAAAQAGLDPGPSPVYCWPHHFDIATYVALEAGDPETARGIGVGLSPGDGAYDQPYLYVNPWPAPDTSGLP